MRGAANVIQQMLTINRSSKDSMGVSQVLELGGGHKKWWKCEMVGGWMTAKPYECWYYVCSLSPLQVRVIMLRPLSVGVKVIMIWRNRRHLPMELPLFQTAGHDGSQDKQTQVAAMKRSDIAIP
jgi:hypothetical protein